MSTLTEDDTELRELVTKVLDDQGVLGKIKAQLRAHVYTALETSGKKDPSTPLFINSSLANRDLKDFLSTTSGRLIASLVREFLEFFNLDFTLAVFDPETNVGKDFQYRGRSRLVDALGLTELVDSKSPLLTEIMRLSKVSVLKSESPTPTDISEADNTSNHISLGDDFQSLDKNKYSTYKQCSKVEDVSDHTSGTVTPEAEQTKEPFELKKTLPEEEEKKSSTEVLNKTFTPPQASAKPSLTSGSNSSTLLSDLPPLPGRHVGDFPPLGGQMARPGALAPLKKIPPLSLGDPDKPKDSSSHKPEAGRGDGPEKSGSARPTESKDVKPTDGSRAFQSQANTKDDESEMGSVAEELDEELDSFLNSSQSGGDEFTKEDNLANSDASLKADYLESL